MSAQLGLISPKNTHSNVANAIYLKKGEPIIAPTVVEPLSIVSRDGTTNAAIYVAGATPDPGFQGAVAIYAGENTTVGSPQVLGITVVGTSSTSASVLIGDDSSSSNKLLINGNLGLGQVYDEEYKQPVALREITIVASDPDTTPTGGAEVFRCTQTAVAQAGAGTIQFNRIQVPRTGAYALQSEFRVGNGPGVNTVVLPSTVVGGVPIWNALFLGIQEFSTVISVPYSSVEVIGGDFQAVDAFEPSSFTTRVYSQVVFLDSTKVYAVTLGSNSALWNIGTEGQIKAELIAMC